MLKAAVIQNSLDGLPVLRNTVVEGVNHSQGGLAFAQIAGYRLAQNLLGRGQIKHVVHNLKRQSDSPAIGGQISLLGLACSSQHCPQSHRYRKHASSLATEPNESPS